jgi:uncharacterized protein (TIGR02099 family)
VFLKYCFAFFKHGSLWTYRIATYGVLLLGAIFLALVIGLRYLVLPHIDNYREPIAQALTSAVGSRVTIGSISGNWQGYRPEMSLMDVRVFAENGAPALALDRVTTVLAWSSLLHGSWTFESLAIYGPALEVKRDAGGVLWIAGIALRPREGGGGFGDWLLAQREVVVRDATLTWLDELRGAPPLKFEKVNLRLDRDAAMHRFGLSAVPPALLASPLVVRGEFVGRNMRELQLWNGKLYVAIDHADLAAAQTWIPAPFELSSGSGALRLWLELNGTQVGAATAELGLADVRTRVTAELPELALARVQGRLGWTRGGNRTRIFANAFGFTLADGRRLAPMQFSFTRSAPAGGARHCELTLSGLDLALVTQMAEFLPLEASVRGRLARAQPAGNVQDATLMWEGAWGGGRPYAVKARFGGLSMRADGALPGFHGLSGQMDANERGGTLVLTASSAGLELPKIFAEPIPIDFLTANAAWTVRQGAVDVTVRNASFANEHAVGSVAGSYRGAAEGPGSVDLSGTLVRAEARQIWRYMPVALAGTQAWLKRALLAGESKETRFRLRGALKDFPFPDDRNGIFEIKTKASGVTLDFAPGWPPITGISGDVVFRGNRMEAHARSGVILGVQLSDVQASIAQLGRHAEHLLINGTAAGATPDFLRFVAATPVSERLERLTEQVKAAGEARLALALDLDLHQIKESSVKGDLTLQNNLVTLDPRLPPLEQFAARIAFTERRFTVRDGRARLFGAPLSFEASTQAGGDITANIAGTLDMDEVRTVWSHPALAFLDGKTAWRASIGVHNKIANVRLHSDLVGLKSSLPAPFAKPAAAKLPLRADLREQPGRPAVLAVNLGQVGAAQLLLDGSARGGISKGTVSLGDSAELPAAPGLWIRGDIDVVDADVWRSVLAEGGAADAAPVLGGVDLRIGILYVNRRRFHDLDVKASKQDAQWQIALDGREIAGRATWISEGEGQLQARLTKLSLPPVTTVIQAGKPEPVDARLPSVDLIADSFGYEGMDLGRLAVLGQPEPAGWQLRNLEIVNPDSRFAMNGHWVMGQTSQTDVAVKLNVSDVGRFLGRLGWPNAVKGGKATLEGPLKWIGNPARFDIPSLSGQLKLEAKDGRFQEIEPGVAKLLGILSLQALPKRVTLDFRDIFSKGFSFDRIAANVKITRGVADTEDFVMHGSAARVAMHGEVDLAAETQALTVRVTPSLSEGIAIAGAIVNPAIGVAALIAQKALKDPLSQIASFDYAITGTWADPVITRISKGPANTKQTGR